MMSMNRPMIVDVKDTTWLFYRTILLRHMVETCIFFGFR